MGNIRREHKKLKKIYFENYLTLKASFGTNFIRKNPENAEKLLEKRKFPEIFFHSKNL